MQYQASPGVLHNVGDGDALQRIHHKDAVEEVMDILGQGITVVPDEGRLTP